MLDLKPFFGTDKTRPYLHHAFSRGEFSFATNGHICIRIEKIPDAPEQKLPDVTALPWDTVTGFAPLQSISLPAKEKSVFEDCDCWGGKDHECPDCECICETCNGNGKIEIDGDNKKSATILGVPIFLGYVRLLAALPNLEVAIVNVLKQGAIAFKFDGGDGFVMSLRKPYKDNIVLK